MIRLGNPRRSIFLIVAILLAAFLLGWMIRIAQEPSNKVVEQRATAHLARLYPNQTFRVVCDTTPMRGYVACSAVRNFDGSVDSPIWSFECALPSVTATTCRPLRPQGE